MMKRICKFWYILVLVITIIGIIPCFGWINYAAMILATIGLVISFTSLVTVFSLEDIIEKKVIESSKNKKELKSNAAICLIICIIALIWCPFRWWLGFFII